MPERLFAADAQRERTPSRQSSLVVASIVAHGAVLIALILVSVLVPGVLPSPHIAMAWSSPHTVTLVDIPLPPRPAAARPLPPISDPATAPVVAPDSIAPEPERTPEAPPTPGVIDGPPVAGFSDAFATVAPPPPPAPPPQTAGPIRLHAGVQPPVKIRDAVPDYPTLARSARAQGVVIIEATIDADGHVVATRVLRSVPLLDEAALDTVRRWQYTPARLNGEPVSVLMTVTVRFQLGP